MYQDKPSLLHQFLTLSAKYFPDKCALVFGPDRWTYAELDQLTERLSFALKQIGLMRQERVVILLDNCPEAVVAFYGVLKAGGTFVLLNGGVKAPKLSYILSDATPTILITHAEKSGVVAEALRLTGKSIKTIWIGGRPAADISAESYLWSDMTVTDLVSRASSLVGEQELGSGHTNQDLAALIYTSGSTGEPKGIMAPHNSVIAAASSIIEYLDNRSEDVVIVSLPLSFDYGLYQVIMAFMYGGTVVLERSFLYPVRILERIAQEKVTGFPVVPTIAALLTRINGVERYDLGSLRYITSTGAFFPESHAKKLRELAPHARLFSMFGLTECKRVSYLAPEEWEKRPDSVGKPMPNCEVYIVDEEGNEVGANQTGEMIVRGPNVMRGYWNDPVLTDRTFREWKFPGEKVLFTGDYFKKDIAGFLYFLGRKDDQIKTRGERVAPREVENILSKMDGIYEVAVTGITDDVLGQAVAAFIVRDFDGILEKADVLKFASTLLEP
ncbi:MAG: AMP-binding protein, partial [Thermovirgaceae bacterium]|nr:AMP-binding protein [Thermovirgaceae bacterium]